jgi:myo-inositol-1(or 4)-monophosphatase
MHDYLTVCERAARAGGAVLLDWVDRFAVREKGPSDLVTEADLASQNTIRDLLLTAFPDHAFLGEESTEVPVSRPYRWIVDPLDGTTNYVHQVPQYAVSVALEHSGKLLVGAV